MSIRPWKRGTAAQRAANHVVPAGGEIGVETDTGNIVISDGVTSWANLTPIGGGTSTVSSVFGRIGAVVAQSGDYSVGQISGLSSALTGFLPKTGGTMSGPIAMGSNKVTGLATPTASTDATTKAYVDASTAEPAGAVVYVQPSGSDSNSGLTWGLAKATIAAAIAALPAGGGLVCLGGGTFTGSSTGTALTGITYASGATFNCSTAASGWVGQYLLWVNQGRIGKVASVVAGTSFTLDVTPTTTTATTALLVAPLFVIPEGVHLEGMGPSFQVNGGSVTACTQINDSGTGVTALIRGANADTLDSSSYGLSQLTLNNTSTAQWGLFVGNGAWYIDSDQLDIANYKVGGIGLDNNVNSHDFRNTTLRSNGNVSASTATGGVVMHPYVSGTSAACQFYNAFFNDNIGFGITDGVQAGGAYGVTLIGCQYNGTATSAATNSGTSMKLLSTGVGPTSVVGGWSESAAGYDLIASGALSIHGFMFASTVVTAHILIDGTYGYATKLSGCFLQGLSSGTSVVLVSGGAIVWDSTGWFDNGATPYTGCSFTALRMPQLGSSASLVTPAPYARDQAYAPSGSWETQSRMVSGVTATITSQVLTLVGIWLPAGFSVGHIAFDTQGTAAITPTHWWYGLYDSSRVQLALTADQTTTPINSFTVYNWPIATTAAGSATSFVTTYTGLHYLGLMVQAGTVPNFYGSPFWAAPFSTPLIAGTSDTAQTTPPAFPHTATGISISGAPPLYGYVS